MDEVLQDTWHKVYDTDVMQKMCDAAREVCLRLSWCSLGFTRRALVLQSAVLPRALHACEVHQYNKRLLAQLESSILKVLWGSGRALRSKEIILTLLAPTHLVHPFSFCVYRRLVTFRRVLLKRTASIDVLRRTWETRSSSNPRCAGPVANIFEAVKYLGWSWSAPTIFNAGDGRVLRCEQMPAKVWQHEVREGLRLVLWSQLINRRPEFDGLQSRVDRISTLALLHGKRLDEYGKGLLRSVLAGAVWHGLALAKAGLVATNICPHCNSNAPEDLDHIWWHCPAWQDIRKRYSTVWFSFMSSWPSCFKLFGIMPCSHAAFDHLSMDAALSGDPSDGDYLQRPSHLSQAWGTELYVAGRVVVYTDGASSHNCDIRLRRAGSGGFWARDHDYNFSVRVDGDVQTNQRAELLAVLRVLETDMRPLDIRTDSKYVLDGCAKLLHTSSTIVWLDVVNGDLWAKVDGCLRARAAESITFTKVKGHSTWADVRGGKCTRQDKLGNDSADFLATMGAAQHVVDIDLRRRVLNSRELTKAVQLMMVDILAARTKASVDVQDVISVCSSSEDVDVISVSSDDVDGFDNLLDDYAASMPPD